jgi:hypothetical protein
VERPAPALVSAALWQQANDQILKNRAVPNGNQQRDYTLRGLMICAQCGLYYSGTRITAKPFYRCGGRRLRQCKSKILGAEWAEMHVWDMVSRWLWKAKEDPFDQVEIIDTAAEKAQLQRQLLNKEEGRQRIITAFRESDFLTHTDVRQQIKAIDEEKRAIEAQLQHLEQQDIVLGVFKDKYKRLMELDLSGEHTEKRRLITEYTSTITVATEGVGRKKNATVTVRFLNGEERTIKRCWWHTTVHEVEYPGEPGIDLTDLPQEP